MTFELKTLRNIFHFPGDFSTEELLQNTPETCANISVVAIIGKGKLNPFSSKATPINPIIDKDIFHGTESFLRDKITEGTIECYYDSDSKIMYLHVISHYDVNLLADKCNQYAHENSGKDIYSILQEEEQKHTQNLLLVFTLSHIILLCHPGGTFDMSYLKLFHSVESIRLKLQDNMANVLSTVPGVGKDWADFGRLCAPRMLFLFETPLLEVLPDDVETGLSKANKKCPPMRKLQMSLEDIIYKILRKARAITNITNNSLFSVPGNMEFVYIHCKRPEVADPADYMIQSLRQQCFPISEEHLAAGIKPKPYSASRRKMFSGVPNPLPLAAPSAPVPHSHSGHKHSSKSLFGSSRWGQEQGLKEFLMQHIEMVFSKSINDNVGRHGIEPIFVLPSLGTWLQAAKLLHQFLFKPTSQHVTHTLTNTIRNTLDISHRFSEARCKKVMPMAENAYQQDLPPFYISAYHENKINKAKRVFSQYARGPATEAYLIDLEKSCEAFWRNGHQQCEILSLTGNLCNSKIHKVPDDNVSPEAGELVCDHVSQVKTKAACNCGKLIKEKEDPFTHKFANFDFYQSIEATCCGRLEHLDLPVFSPTTSDARAATLEDDKEQEPEDVQSPENIQPFDETNQQLEQTDQTVNSDAISKDVEKGEVFSTLSELSLALSLGQTVGESETKSEVLDISKDTTLKEDDTSVVKTEATVDTENTETTTGGQNKESVSTVDRVSVSSSGRESTQSPTNCQCPSDKVAPSMSRQHSTTEYLPYMLHSRSPQGLLPKFPSFSLCKLGTANFYSHMHGLDLPGFLPGGNFLLPWDIAVKSEEKWPTVNETFAGGKKRLQRKTYKADNGDAMTSVRVYLGMEYECPRGHRFFCSGPDKVIKVSSNSIVKDNAGRLVNMDMPIYTMCQCKQTKAGLAQLMRIYIVTPRHLSNCPAVQVMLHPLVQAGPPPCPQFHPGLDGPLPLPPDAVWCLRLPQIYQDEHAVHLMPTDPQLLHECYVPKGVFSYTIL